LSGGGFLHSTGLFGSEAEFVRLVIPFLADGLEAGEPVTAAFTETNQNVVREVFGDRVNYVDARTQYDCPGRDDPAFPRTLRGARRGGRKADPDRR
jgi:hypothetical protein